MFRGAPDGKKKAADIARYFASYSLHQSHGMGIGRDDARGRGVNITDLEKDAALQDAVLSVHHATMHTLSGAAVKLVENHIGKMFAKLQQVMQVQVPVLQPGPMPGPGVAPQPTLAAPPRQV
ncbi:MAG: hypothetical protein M3P11_12955 [Actinomycetota bacterium]|nr:hypothetical protein [Actinomycetota bacterium]MDP9331532.1 hypothetical protein [Actinomycetota bacterium]